MTAKRNKRMELAPPGNWDRPSVGHGYPSSTRCRATHDVPYSLRCTVELVWDERNSVFVHDGQHRDKEGNEWPSQCDPPSPNRSGSWFAT